MSGSARNTILNKLPAPVREEWFLGVSVLTSVVFVCFGNSMMAGLANPLVLVLLFAWLFLVVLGSVICVVRHADHLAMRLGEPYGTLILTLAVTAIEVISISTMMLHGGSNPTLVRDTLFAVVMIILNGMVGVSLLVGGWRHREQQFNLQGANAYLSVIIPLAVMTLILPNYTTTTVGPTLSYVQEIFLALMSIGLCGIFLLIQTNRHRMYFVLGETKDAQAEHPPGASRSLTAHTALLAAYMVPVVFLTEQLAQPIDYLIEVMHAPAPFGGAIIAIMVATPEAIGAVKAARANQLQRSVNIFLGSVWRRLG